ncbi:MAG: methyltransferase domain-containing protein [Bacteroidia bacterium]|nr:methyltransferase domain-containing protein [Bacteroidia bacterium]
MSFIKFTYHQFIYNYKKFGIKGVILYAIYLKEFIFAKLNFGKKSDCKLCGAKEIVFLPLLIPPITVRKNMICKCGSMLRHAYYGLNAEKYLFFKLNKDYPYIIYHFIAEQGLIDFWKRNFSNSEYHVTCFPGKIEGSEVLDLTNLSLPSESADILIANRVFTCIEDISNTFKECYRVLKKGGYLVLGDEFIEGKNTKGMTAFSSYGNCYRTFGSDDFLEIVSPFENYNVYNDLSEFDRNQINFSLFECLIVLQK